MSEQKPNSAWAITSLALGIVSVIVPGLVTAAAARGIHNLTLGIVLVAGLGLLAGAPPIVLGWLAWSRALKAPSQYGGQACAAAGRALGCGSVLVTLWLTAIVLPNFAKARVLAQREVCVALLERIDMAKDMWGLENKKTVGEPVVAAELETLLKNARPTARIMPDGSRVALPDLSAHFSASGRPICPAGGTYSYNVLCTKPTCSLGAALGHTL